MRKAVVRIFTMYKVVFASSYKPSICMFLMHRENSIDEEKHKSHIARQK